MRGFPHLVIHVDDDPDGDPDRTAGHVAAGQGEADVVRLVHGAEELVEVEKSVLRLLAVHVSAPPLGEVRIGHIRGVLDGHGVPDAASRRGGVEGIVAEDLLARNGAVEVVVVELKGYDLHDLCGLWVGKPIRRSQIGGSG